MEGEISIFTLAKPFTRVNYTSFETECPLEQLRPSCQTTQNCTALFLCTTSGRLQFSHIILVLSKQLQPKMGHLCCSSSISNFDNDTSRLIAVVVQGTLCVICSTRGCPSASPLNSQAADRTSTFLPPKARSFCFEIRVQRRR